MVVLILLLRQQGATWAVENPWESFLWALRSMQKLLKMRGAELVLLHQWAYGSSTQKPTGILAAAKWMKSVCAFCAKVRNHYHVEGGLAGRAWDYLKNCEVWEKGLAADYPCGLCMAWSNSLKQWLASSEGWLWLSSRTFKLTGRWNNQLVRLGQGFQSTANDSVILSAKELREKENRAALGGLKNPRHAVQRSTPLRLVGARLRRIIEPFLQPSILSNLLHNIKAGVPEAWVQQVRQAIAAEFKVESNYEGGLYHALWHALLREAADPDR